MSADSTNDKLCSYMFRLTNLINRINFSIVVECIIYSGNNLYNNMIFSF